MLLLIELGKELKQNAFLSIYLFKNILKVFKMEYQENVEDNSCLESRIFRFFLSILVPNVINR